LHHLENEGYHIEYHAYNHEGKEFNCNKPTAEEKVNKSFEILKDCGFNTTNIKYFIPPRYEPSDDAENIFLNKNFTIIMDYYIVKKKGELIKIEIITNKEYTWYLPKNMTKEMEILALSDYKTSQHQFYLSIHPKAINYGGGLEFLDYFLNKTG
jgi:predicted deacetylase